MAINVSVQHNNGGFLPGIILLTQCYYYAMKRFCICSLWSHLTKCFNIFPLDWGICSEGLDAFRFFFQQPFITGLSTIKIYGTTYRSVFLQTISITS